MSFSKKKVHSKGKTGNLGELRYRIAFIDHLDRVHAERPGRFQVGAEIVQKNRVFGFNVQSLASELVNPQIRFADAFNARFDHQIKQRHHPGNFGAAFVVGTRE